MAVKNDEIGFEITSEELIFTPSKLGFMAAPVFGLPSVGMLFPVVKPPTAVITPKVDIFQNPMQFGATITPVPVIDQVVTPVSREVEQLPPWYTQPIQTAPVIDQIVTPAPMPVLVTAPVTAPVIAPAPEVVPAPVIRSGKWLEIVDQVIAPVIAPAPEVVPAPVIRSGKWLEIVDQVIAPVIAPAPRGGAAPVIRSGKWLEIVDPVTVPVIAPPPVIVLAPEMPVYPPIQLPPMQTPIVTETPAGQAPVTPSKWSFPWWILLLLAALLWGRDIAND